MIILISPAKRLNENVEAEVHQVITAGGARLEEKEYHPVKGRTQRLDATRRDVNSPAERMQAQVFFPAGSFLFASLDGEGIVCLYQQ